MLNVKLTRGAAAAACGAEKKEAAAAAWKTLLDGAAAGKNGFGWMNLPEADISGLVAMGQDLSKYSNIIVIGIGGSARPASLCCSSPITPTPRATRLSGSRSIPRTLRSSW